MEVEFKFTIDDKVKTPFGKDGIVTMLGVDDGGVKYYIKTGESSDWHKESEVVAR